MGLADFDSSSFDSDKARYERMNRTNPSEFPPGQGDDMDLLFSNDVLEPSAGGNSMFDTSFQQVSGMGMQGNQQPQQQQLSDEDKLFSALGNGTKATYGFVKDFVSSFSEVTPYFWQTWGHTTTIIGGICFATGLVTSILGIKIGMPLMRGSVLSLIVTIPTWLGMTEKARQCTSKYKEDNSERDVTYEDMFNTESVDSESSIDTEFDTSDDFMTDSDSFNDDFSDYDSDTDYDEFLDFTDYADDVDEKPKDGMDMEESLNSMQVIDKGMYTRQYLYDVFTRVLPTCTPSFDKMYEYTEDDDAFIYWEEKLREAATVSGMKDEYLPELYELSENLFIVKLVCDRPQGFKPDVIAQELSNIYAYNEGVSSISYRVEPVGARCYITLFTGKTEMISLRDMYTSVSDFILDTKNFMPIVIGVTTDGKVVIEDFKTIESIIVTGMPRSGKSWFVQNILYQMCAYVSPKELNIYICDPKEQTSDYSSFILPHVKGFESDDNKVLDLLRRVVKVDAIKRKKLIGSAGCVNIWQYKKKYPDVEMPIIYVVIDEIVTFASRMDKDTHKEFRGLLRELISQLPALGIRALLIPHMLNNDIIEKKTSDLVNCRISVCGDAEHIEKATGAKPRQFPYKLSNKGDMAVRMPTVNPDTMFIHASVLTPDNDINKELFDYARRVWSKLEPDSVENSVAKSAEIDKQNEDLLKKLSASDTMKDIEINW